MDTNIRVAIGAEEASVDGATPRVVSNNIVNDIVDNKQVADKYCLGPGEPLTGARDN